MRAGNHLPVPLEQRNHFLAKNYYYPLYQQERSKFLSASPSTNRYGTTIRSAITDSPNRAIALGPFFPSLVSLFHMFQNSNLPPPLSTRLLFRVLALLSLFFRGKIEVFV
ncbi:hypothetical protein AVEN_81773-1 [Araneus ventricosus]|uniref:Uncharacterized protein n=1 Tax=Araneus ventricosus TaxID=182803 RepID=A0A4Y2KFX4_ARAVE|nr:hypothetical protein AVEN_81773-1 [Araneus ventricosus]